MRLPTGVTAGFVADLVGGELIGNREHALAGVATLSSAGPGDLAFAAHAEAGDFLRSTRAGAVIITRSLQPAVPPHTTSIVVEHPVSAAAEVIAACMVESWGVHPTARLGRGCRWEGRIRVEAGAVVGPDVRFGPDCRVGPGAVIEEGVRCGARCCIEALVTVQRHTRIGSDVVIRAGARVGGPGFGFVREGMRAVRVPQLAGCVIGDDVEVGGNATIDRGGARDTEIGDGTKIDNLVQVAHNVRIGRRCIVMAQVGIAGSVTVEDDVLIAGQAGLADHLTVGRAARVAAQSGVIGDVPAGGTVSGYPARDHRSVLRQTAALARVTPLVSDLERIVQRNE